MRAETESVWIGRLEVSPREDAEVLRDSSGAFVNVVTWASNEVEFLEKAAIVMKGLKLAIMGVEDAEPVTNRGVVVDEDLSDIVSRVQNNRSAIIYSTFHTWSERPI
jgi:hypothetical protein